MLTFINFINYGYIPNDQSLPYISFDYSFYNQRNSNREMWTSTKFVSSLKKIVCASTLTRINSSPIIGYIFYSLPNYLSNYLSHSGVEYDRSVLKILQVPIFYYVFFLRKFSNSHHRYSLGTKKKKRIYDIYVYIYIYVYYLFSMFT